MKIFLTTVIVICAFTACNNNKNNGEVGSQAQQKEFNPAAEGFNYEESDSLAINIADSVMMAMGGRQAWDNVKVISWNFFGVRDLVWHKPTGQVRIEDNRDSSIYLINVLKDTGKVLRNGAEITDPDSLSKYISRGKSIWINDSYWLVMPFKLKDSGVALKYDRQDTTQTGIKAHVLTLTFNNVGDTPDNKYEVYIDKKDHLIKQWAYFKSYEQDSASAIWPWDNYKEYNGLKLSANRSDGKGPKNVKLLESVPDSLFTTF